MTGFGFRDFRVVDGYFRLNNRRLFVKSTHTGNHCPYRMISPPDGYPDMLRKDLLYAKACGFNMVRFISGVAHPYELDLCDELGLMVYEESSGSWLLKRFFRNEEALRRLHAGNDHSRSQSSQRSALGSS